jgi:hypothetical protein
MNSPNFYSKYLLNLKEFLWRKLFILSRSSQKNHLKFLELEKIIFGPIKISNLDSFDQFQKFKPHHCGRGPPISGRPPLPMPSHAIAGPACQSPPPPSRPQPHRQRVSCRTRPPLLGHNRPDPRCSKSTAPGAPLPRSSCGAQHRDPLPCPHRARLKRAPPRCREPHLSPPLPPVRFKRREHLRCRRLHSISVIHAPKPSLVE